MFRDNRDPQAIGEALIRTSALQPDMPITQLADMCLADGIAHRLYGESAKDFELRISAPDPFRGNRKLVA